MNPLPISSADAVLIDPQPKADRVEQLDERQAAEQFTSVLMSMVVKEMFNTTSIDGKSAFGSGPGADIYKGFAEQAFGEALAKNSMDALVERVQEAIQRTRPTETNEESTDSEATLEK